MKTIRITLLLIALLGVQLVKGQSKSDKIYDVFSGKEGVTNFTFSKNMIDAIDIDLGDDDDETRVTGDLNKIRFLSYNPKKGNLSGTEFIKKATAMLPSAYKKYEEEDNHDNDAEIWLLGKNRKFTECHVFVTNEQDEQMRFIVSFYGDFNVNDIKGLKKKSKGFSDQ